MKIICDKCKNIINRDNYVGKTLVEEYNNVYGTVCLNCGNIIKPIKNCFLNKNEELKIEILKEEMREKIRKRIQGENKCL